MGNAISKSITLIINQSLRTGIFPNKLKIAKVIPIFNFVIFLAILNLCLPLLITLNAILITVMYVKIQFRFVLFVCVMLF